MDTIKATELKTDYPKTWEAIDKHGFKYYASPGNVRIRLFLERNGYSICCLPLVHSEKYIPQIVFHGREVGSDRFFRENDFEPMSLKEAEKVSLMFALRDFEKHCYEPCFWD